MLKQQISKCSPDDLNRSRAAVYIYWQQEGWDLHTCNFLMMSEFPKNNREKKFSRAWVEEHFVSRPWLKSDISGDEYDKWLKG